MPRCGATFDENDGHSGPPLHLPPYALRKGEKAFSREPPMPQCGTPKDEKWSIPLIVIPLGGKGGIG